MEEGRRDEKKEQRLIGDVQYMSNSRAVDLYLGGKEMDLSLTRSPTHSPSHWLSYILRLKEREKERESVCVSIADDPYSLLLFTHSPVHCAFHHFVFSKEEPKYTSNSTGNAVAYQKCGNVRMLHGSTPRI